MLAYRVNKSNAPFIRRRNGGEVPEEKGYTTYIIFPVGEDGEGVVVTEPDFYTKYTITTRISRKLGRYVVESKTQKGDASQVQQTGKVQRRGKPRSRPHPGIQG